MRLRVLIISLLLLAVGGAHWVTPIGEPHFHVFHVAMRKMFILPIVLAAVWFNLKGGLLAAAAATALYTYHVYVHWSGHPTENVNQVGELATLWIVAALSGWLVGREKRTLQRLADRRRAEMAVRESAERLAQILESALDAIIAIDERLIVRVFNSAAERVFRCAAEDAIGRPFNRFASKQMQTLLRAALQSLQRGEEQRRYLWAPEGVTALRRNGERFPVEATIAHAETTDAHLYTIILRDVDDRKRAEEELKRLQLENISLRLEVGTDAEPDAIIGSSEAIKQILRSVAQVAGTDATVLLTGETGTGKELVAKAIHNQSARRDRLLLKVNCAALPSGLIESELFGHEKGAFTGAVARKLGRFELADGGTIFLDEVGDLPLELQAKLLRVLQEGEFERVGGTNTLTTDARVIAATNRDLETAVAEGAFRADLFYRLNIFPIRIPSLRERVEDIPQLVLHFAVEYATRMGRKIETIPKSTMNALLSYHWPGNVRELQNVIERGVILSVSRGGQLDLGDWLPAQTAAATHTPLISLREIERHHIIEVLKATRWRVRGKDGAAQILDLKPTTLESRMKKLEIRRPLA